MQHSFSQVRMIATDMDGTLLTEKVITEHFMFIKTSRIGSGSILRFPEYRWMI